MNAKLDVRKIVRARLQFSSGERAEKSERLCAAIRRQPRWSQAQTVAFFAPQPQEPDVELLWNSSAGKVICYPRVCDQELKLFQVRTPADLLPSRWGLREPPLIAAQAVSVAEIDLILVPGVAFTVQGDRLGRGGGFYDRLLAVPRFRALKIGVCFAVQLFAELPQEAHDVRVDYVVTEETTVTD